MGGEERSKARPNIWLYLGIIRAFPNERNTHVTQNGLNKKEHYQLIQVEFRYKAGVESDTIRALALVSFFLSFVLSRDRDRDRDRARYRNRDRDRDQER